MGIAGVSFLTLLVFRVNFNEIVIVIVNYSDSTSRFPFSIPIPYPTRYPVQGMALESALKRARVTERTSQ